MTHYPKRKPVSDRIKVFVCLRQNGKCACGCGVKLDALKEGIDYDHRPSLGTRPKNDAGTDYVPPQLDPDYIDALRRPCHKNKTPKDTKDAAKCKRLNGETGNRTKKKIPKRGFDKSLHKSMTTGKVTRR